MPKTNYSKKKSTIRKTKKVNTADGERRKQEELRRPYQNKTGKAIRNATPFDRGARQNAPFLGTEKTEGDWGAGGGDRGFKQRGSTLKTGFWFFSDSCSCKLGRGSGLTLADDVGQLGNGEET